MHGDPQAFLLLQFLCSKSIPNIDYLMRKVPRKVFAEDSRGRFSPKVHEICGRFLRKVFAESSAEGFGGRFPRKVFTTGTRDSRKVPRKVFAEGLHERIFCGRFPEGFRKDSGRFWKVLGLRPCLSPSRKLFCGRFCERFLRKVLRKVFAEGSAEGSRKVFGRRLKN